MTTIKLVLSNILNEWVDALDLALNTDRYFILPKEGIVCRNCKKKVSIKQNNKYVSLLCGCGCKLFYPPDKNGIVVSKFISKDDYNGGTRK